VDTLWRHSRAANETVQRALAQLGIENPRHATDGQRQALLAALYQPLDQFAGARVNAFARVALLLGARISAADGSRTDAACVGGMIDSAAAAVDGWDAASLRGVLW
jgi:hypothetical protein